MRMTKMGYHLLFLLRHRNKVKPNLNLLYEASVFVVLEESGDII